jgi:hypothetical protein
MPIISSSLLKKVFPGLARLDAAAHIGSLDKEGQSKVLSIAAEVFGFRNRII